MSGISDCGYRKADSRAPARTYYSPQSAIRNPKLNRAGVLVRNESLRELDYEGTFMKTHVYLWGLALSVLTGCVGDEPVPVTTTTTTTREVTTTGPVVQESVVTQAPPPVRVETMTTAPGPGYVWTRGYWRWSGANYDWVSGTWVARPRPAAVWIDGHWIRRGGGWVWVRGHWG